MIFVQVAVNGLLLGAVYALFSSGLTLIWGMTDVINFAHGEFVMLAMYVTFFSYTLLGIGPPGFIIIATIALFLFGIAVYFSLIKHVLRGPMLAQIISTFGLALFLRSAALWAFSANFVSLPNNLVGGTLHIGSINIGVAHLLAGLTSLLVTFAMHFLLTRTTLGSRMLAVAEDATAAALMGIRPDPVQALTWGLGAAATGLAGALIALFFYVSPEVGNSYTLLAFVTVCLGGFGSVPGALLGGLAIGLIQTYTAYFIGATDKNITVLALFVLLLWIRPQGLFGRR